MNASPADQAPPVDLQALQSLFGDDVELQRSLLKQFVPQAEKDIGEMEQALDQDDAGQVSFFAHKLKSPSRSVGANRLADLALELESAAKATDWDRIREVSPQIRPEMARVREFIGAL